MMKRSFSEIDSAKNESNRVIQLKELSEKLNSEKELECSKCVPSIEEYYKKCSQITELHKEIQVSGTLHLFLWCSSLWASITCNDWCMTIRTVYHCKN